MCPRVGTLVIGLMGGTALAVLSFFFQVCQTNRPAPEAKKFASLSKAAGFQRAESFGRSRRSETPQLTVINSLTVRTANYKPQHGTSKT